MNWYFSRSSLAKKLADDYTDIGKDRIAIYARRQKGKTQFCQKDLIPEMEERGYFSVYINFDLYKTAPETAFLNGVSESYDKTEEAFPITPFSIVKPQQVDCNTLPFDSFLQSHYVHEAADEAISCLLKHAQYRKLFIVLDEVHHLGMNKDFLSFTAKLRSYIVNRSQRATFPIKVLFISSDHSKLSTFLKDPNSPFYLASRIVNFPDLDEEFVQFGLNIYHKSMNKEVDLVTAYKIFCEGGNRPGAFIDLIQEMILLKSSNLKTVAIEKGYL